MYVFVILLLPFFKTFPAVIVPCDATDDPATHIRDNVRPVFTYGVRFILMSHHHEVDEG